MKDATPQTVKMVGMLVLRVFACIAFVAAVTWTAFFFVT
jgi:hypothetical protein